MPERATIFQKTQLGVETTPGTNVPATKILQATTIQPAIKADVKTFRTMGSKFPSLAAEGKEWVEAKIEGQGSYHDLTYLLASLMCTPTPAQQGGTTAYKSTFVVANGLADLVTTYSVEHGGSVRGHEFSYGLVNELGLDISRDEVKVSGTMIGQRLTDDVYPSTNEIQTIGDSGVVSGGHCHFTFGGQTTGTVAWNADAATVQAALEALSTIGTGGVRCTGGPLPGDVVVEFIGPLAQTNVALLTVDNTAITGGGTIVVAETLAGAAPTYIAYQPILPAEISVYLAATAAGLPGSALTRVLKCSWKLGSRFGPIWVLDASKTSWVVHVETEPDMTATILMEADAAGMALLTQLRSGASKFLRIEAVSAALAGVAYPYTLTLDMCGKVSAVSEFSDADGVYAIEWTLKGAYDSTWGKACQVEVTSTLSAL